MVINRNQRNRSALVKLYDKDIMKHLELIHRDPGKAGELTELLEIDRIEELIEEFPNSADFSRKLFEELKNSELVKADSDRLYREVMTYLNKHVPRSDLHKILKCSGEKERRSGFGKILRHFDGFFAYTEPKSVIEYLGAFPNYDDIVRSLREEMDRIGEENEENMQMMKKLILRTVPILGDFSVYDVMYAIYHRCSQNNMSEAREFIESVQRGFDAFYRGLNISRRQVHARIVICPVNQSATEMMMQLGTPAIEHNPRFRMVNLQFDDIPIGNSMSRIVIQTVQERVHMQRALCLRNYQEELCRVALRGDNTIVTAPTGPGKTVIAANILKEHFETRKRDGRPFKALFMTPNSMILKQQSDSISSYLEHCYHIQIIQGADNVPIRSAIDANDLIVATPQMIVNLCAEHLDESQDFRPARFFLSTFTIIIFDECHNTLKNSPYANIMREYHTLKNMGNMPDGHRLPQIIGLTASLGTGDSKNEREVVYHIAELCATMNVKELSVVRENVTELTQYSPIVPDTVFYCERSIEGPIATFTKWLCQMMAEVEKRMTVILRTDGIRIQTNNAVAQNPGDREFTTPPGFITPPADREHSAYLCWVCNALNTVSTCKDFKDSMTKLAVNEALTVLKKCYLTLTYNANFNPTVALNFLREEIEDRVANFTHEMTMIWERYHNHLSTNGSGDNPMITQVEKYLREEHDRNPDFRAIIFMKTRYEAKILNEILNQSQTLIRLDIKADKIFGLNKSTNGAQDAESAASKRAQMEKLAKFAEGKIKVLVSTSVAEEGLDVAKCNLVIKYNYATNEIAHVQRRGRGRALNSTCVLITNSKALQKQESDNKSRENMMKQALNEVLRAPESFEQQVSFNVENIWRRIQQEETDKAQLIQAQLDRNIEYRILCKKCDMELCRNSHIKANKTQYFVCRPEFWSLVTSKMSSEAERQRDAKSHATGRILCKGPNCGVQLGRLIDIKATSMPCLGAEAIILVGNGERHVVKKWSVILQKHFTPSPIRALDIQIMKDAAPSSVVHFETIQIQ